MIETVVCVKFVPSLRVVLLPISPLRPKEGEGRLGDRSERWVWDGANGYPYPQGGRRGRNVRTVLPTVGGAAAKESKRGRRREEGGGCFPLGWLLRQRVTRVTNNHTRDSPACGCVCVKGREGGKKSQFGFALSS